MDWASIVATIHVRHGDQSTVVRGPGGRERGREDRAIIPNASTDLSTFEYGMCAIWYQP